MTLREADSQLRAAGYGVRVVPVRERRWPYYRCAGYGSADDLEAHGPCSEPVRVVCFPGEEFYFYEDGLFCHECYMRMAQCESAVMGHHPHSETNSRAYPHTSAGT